MDPRVKTPAAGLAAAVHAVESALRRCAPGPVGARPASRPSAEDQSRSGGGCTHRARRHHRRRKPSRRTRGPHDFGQRARCPGVSRRDPAGSRCCAHHSVSRSRAGTPRRVRKATCHLERIARRAWACVKPGAGACEMSRRVRSSRAYPGNPSGCAPSKDRRAGPW